VYRKNWMWPTHIYVFNLIFLYVWLIHNAKSRFDLFQMAGFCVQRSVMFFFKTEVSCNYYLLRLSIVSHFLTGLNVLCWRSKGQLYWNSLCLSPRANKGFGKIESSVCSEITVYKNVLHKFVVDRACHGLLNGILQWALLTFLAFSRWSGVSWNFWTKGW